METISLFLATVVCQSIIGSVCVCGAKPIESYSAIDTANYIAENLSVFKAAYNNSHDIPITALRVVNVTPMALIDVDGESQCCLIDFNGDYGYVVAGPSLVYYHVETSGDFLMENDCSDFSSLGYSTLSGFVHKENGEWKCIDNACDCYENFECGSATNGTVSAKEWEIDSYVRDRYGNDYHEYISNYVTGAPNTTQFDLSMYITNKLENGEIENWSEDNCWYFSSYVFLQCIQKHGYSRLPSKYDTYDYDVTIEEPRLYSTIYDSNGNNISGQLLSSSGDFLAYKRELNNTLSSSVWGGGSTFTVPALYAKSRQRAYLKNYKLDKGAIWQTSGIIEEVAKQYGYDVNVVEHPKWSDKLDSLMTHIISGRPYIWSVSKDALHDYGYHTMVGVGYSIYKKQLQTGEFTDTDTKFFFKLRDGHNYGTTWFDATAYKGHIGSLSFIKI